MAAQLSECWQEGTGRSLACALLGAAAQEEPAVPWHSERGRSVSSRAALRSESLFRVLCWCSCPVNKCEGGARRRGCLKRCWLAKRKNIYSALLKCLGSGSETAEQCLGSAAQCKRWRAVPTGDTWRFCCGFGALEARDVAGPRSVMIHP